MASSHSSHVNPISDSESNPDYNSTDSSDNSDEERRYAWNRELDEIIFQIPQAVGNLLSRRNKQRRGRGADIPRDYESGYNRLFNDYFSDDAVYPERIFRRRFRMRKHVFMKIMTAVEAHDVYFQRRPNATGRLSISALQKCTAAIRMLAYGTGADACDEYIKVSQTVARQSLQRFTKAIVEIFGKEYLRKPNASDLERLLRVGEQRGFPGMLGSIDCMHWEWKNCPHSYKGLYQGRSGKATIILEAVASYDSWIWHAFFGTPGVNNNLDVLYKSPIFDDILHGRAPSIDYHVNGHRYNMGYYLTDGIYPCWATFIQAVRIPQTPEDKLFNQCQEAARKDVERAFRILQARFAIIRRPSLAWEEVNIQNIMKACIILHNMIIEDERDSYTGIDDPNEFNEDHRERASGNTGMGHDNEQVQYSKRSVFNEALYFANRDCIRNQRINESLKADLVANIWNRFGHF